jgi:hypothetical protein
MIYNAIPQNVNAIPTHGDTLWHRAMAIGMVCGHYWMFPRIIYGTEYLAGGVLEIYGLWIITIPVTRCSAQLSNFCFCRSAMACCWVAEGWSIVIEDHPEIVYEPESHAPVFSFKVSWAVEQSSVSFLRLAWLQYCVLEALLRTVLGVWFVSCVLNNFKS